MIAFIVLMALIALTYSQHKLFSKSWTAWVLGVQLAKEGGGVDWVVFLWLTRDDLVGGIS